MGEEHSYKPGSIKSIKLINFMCHDSFEISLGPRVNFIIGPNGSGKSALLTALVVAMGGRATLTQRAKRNSDFIKTGKRSAEITVTLHNYDRIMDKDAAFKPDDYGKEIIIQKVITREDSGRLALKSDKSKKISERKAELDEMIDHFGILINNPICILNQEVSKSFLHSKKPEDKFDLFMKATNLEQITNDYDEAGFNHGVWKERNLAKTTSFKILESEYNSCKEKASFLENRAKLNDMMETYQTELISAIVRDDEEIIAKIEKKLQELTKKFAEHEKTIKDREKKILNHEEDNKIFQAKVDDNQKDLDQAQDDHHQIQEKESEERKKRVDVNSAVEALKRRINRYNDDKGSLEKSIAEMKQQMEEQHNLDHDAERRKMELERLEREIPVEIAKEKNIRQHSNQLDASMLKVREELQEQNFKINQLKNRLAASNAHLVRLKAGQDNTLRKYGDHISRIRQEIERNRNRFIEKPLGPLGYYLKLKNSDMAPALEICLGKNAQAFVCDNSQDMTVLNTIVKKICGPQGGPRQPLVVCRKFGQKHRTDRFRAVHPNYRSFLDWLEIEEACVYNALVDRCRLESILFIPDFYEAENLLLNPATVPKYTKLAFTKDCYAIHPNVNDSAYKCFSNDPSRCMLFKDNNSIQIREQEKEIAGFKSQIRDVEKVFQDIKNNYDAQKNERINNEQEIKRILEVIRSKEEQQLALKTTVVKEPQELSALEEDLEKTIATIAREKLNLEEQMENLRQIDEDLHNVRAKTKLRLEKLKKLEAAKAEIYKIISEQNKTIDRFKKDIRDARIKIETLEKEKAETDDELQKQLEKVARSRANIPPNFETPSRIRPTEAVREDLRKVEAQLRVDIEEMQDPEEMKASLNKRMHEIQNSIQLRDMNLEVHSNFEKELARRKEGLSNLRQTTVGSVATTFASVMRSMKMTGELLIHLDDVIERGEVVKKAKTLEIRVDTNYSPTQRPTQVMNESSNNGHLTSRSQPPPAKRACRSQPDGGKENELRMTDTRSLSGGERSFSTVAFVLALWHHCNSPFKLMDEIDVFMDMVTRRVSYNALIRYAQMNPDPGQFLFFSPLELPKFDDNGSYVRVYEMPSIVRKGPVVQQEE